MDYTFIDNFKKSLKDHSDILITLYNLSEIENTKDECLNPNIGSHREQDLVAFLYYFMPIHSVSFYYKSIYPWDVIISGLKYSIKHQSGNSNTAIKLKWGTNDATKYINNFKGFTYNLIIVSINREKVPKYSKTIIIYIIDETTLNNIYETVKNNTPFVIDNRGIAFSSSFMKQIKEKSEHIYIKSDLLKTLDTEKKALDVRLKLINDMVINK